jgi:hypothetical protein
MEMSLKTPYQAPEAVSAAIRIPPGPLAEAGGGNASIEKPSGPLWVPRSIATVKIPDCLRFIALLHPV